MDWIIQNWLLLFTCSVAIALIVYVARNLKSGTLLGDTPREFEEVKPHPYRELTLEEKHKIHEVLEIKYQRKKYKKFQIPLGIILLICAGAAQIAFSYHYLSPNVYAVCLIFSLVMGIALIRENLANDFSYTQYHNDSDYQVYKVAGKLIYSHKHSYLNRRMSGHGWITVAGVSFNRHNQPSIKFIEELLQDVNNNDVVEIEYSPHSMHIWNIKKI